MQAMIAIPIIQKVVDDIRQGINKKSDNAKGDASKAATAAVNTRQGTWKPQQFNPSICTAVP